MFSETSIGSREAGTRNALANNVARLDRRTRQVSCAWVCRLNATTVCGTDNDERVTPEPSTWAIVGLLVSVFGAPFPGAAH